MNHITNHTKIEAPFQAMPLVMALPGFPGSNAHILARTLHCLIGSFLHLEELKMRIAHIICAGNSPLHSNEVDGNSMAYMANQDRENTASHQDQYKCQCCNELVHGEDFNEEYKICRQCYNCMAEDKHIPPFDGINEYYGEDR